jgi:hypothetical protein
VCDDGIVFDDGETMVRVTGRMHVTFHWSIAVSRHQAAPQRDFQMMRKRKTPSILACGTLLLVALAGCHHTPDETQVREAITSMTHGAESGSTSDVIKPLAEDFDGNAGDLDRKTLANMMRLIALRGDHIGVTSGPITIEHHGDRMVAKLTVTLTSGGRVIPDNLGVYQIESGWRKEDGQWRCYTAHWTQPG